MSTADLLPRRALRIQLQMALHRRSFSRVVPEEHSLISFADLMILSPVPTVWMILLSRLMTTKAFVVWVPTRCLREQKMRCKPCQWSTFPLLVPCSVCRTSVLRNMSISIESWCTDCRFEEDLRLLTWSVNSSRYVARRNKCICWTNLARPADLDCASLLAEEILFCSSLVRIAFSKF